MGKISIYNINDTPIGGGGMGEVYLGWDSNGNAVAIKKMRAELTTDANLCAFFHKEVNTLIQLEHQSIVKMRASFEERGNLYLVMEYVEGETIEQYIKRQGVIAESEAIRLLIDILPAIGYLHQKGFVHRDIKPSNIMIRSNGKVCLLDFGIVKDMKNSNGHTVNQIVGTDGYMSVEQAEGMSIDHRSDIYSLGCVLYYMLIGNHAIQKQSNDYAMRQTIIKSAFPRAKDFNPNLSDNIQRILDKATDKNMLRRFQSCREFELELSGGGTIVSDENNDTVSVGRESCDIIISHPKVSRRHVDIEATDCSEGIIYKIKDRSTNGTVVNGEKIHNNTKDFLVWWRDKRTPSILLAGEVELK
jgi:serine/threonine-protein kinase